MANQSHIFTKIRSGSQAQQLADALNGRGRSEEGRSISTVGALRAAGMGLEVTCRVCGAHHVYHSAEMEQAFGVETALSDIRAPCHACGETALDRIPVVSRD